MLNWLDQTHLGDCRRLMRQMIADGVRVQCVVTSPPYWGLRDYGIAGQFGLERSWVHHVARMRGVFRLVYQLLAEDGTLWLNYGDSYAHPGKWGGETGGMQSYLDVGSRTRAGRERRSYPGLKSKDLVGMPWRVAFALQGDPRMPWWLRRDIIWAKPNPMPESVDDRPTTAHEYLFLMSRSARYHYDAAAIAEPTSPESHRRYARARSEGYAPPGQSPHCGWITESGTQAIADRWPSGWATQGSHTEKKGRYPRLKPKADGSLSESISEMRATRNVRSVWHIPIEGFSGAHFATFPRELAKRCILAGSRPGDVVLDPFMGSGTVAQMAIALGRRYIGLELNPKSIALERLRPTTRGLDL